MSFHEDHSLLGFVDTQPAPELLGEADPVPGRMRIRLASSMWHEGEVNALLERKYTARGYNAPIVRVQSTDNRTMTLFAESATGQLVGTITMRLDGPAGLSCDVAFGAEVQPFRAAGERVCEFGGFGVDLGNEEMSSQASLYVRGALIHTAYIFSRRVHRAERAFIEVNPRHVEFYVRAMGFARACAEERRCERANAPAVLLQVPLDYVGRQLAIHGGRGAASRARTLYSYCFSPEEEKGILSRMSGMAGAVTQ